MEINKINCSMSDLSPIITELINRGDSVRLVVTGNSMQPFLRHNLDSVILKKADAYNLKRGDIPLYIRKNGSYVLHRIKSKHNGKYTIVGDAQAVLEKNVEPESIVAVVCGIYRGEKYISCNNLFYKLLYNIWMIVLPLRNYLLRILKKLKLLKGEM